MHHASIQSMAAELDALRQVESGHEYWLASKLYAFLRLRNYLQFEDVIGSAAEVCNRKGHDSTRHIQPTSPVEQYGEHGSTIIDEYRLSAYGAFLVAKHMDEQSGGVRFMLNYFPATDRDWIALSLRLDAWERLRTRVALRQLEKDFAHAIRNLHLGEEGYGLLKSAGDKVLFGGLSTSSMKVRLGVPHDHVLSDYLPAVTLRARIQADELTIQGLEENPRRSEDDVADLHRHSNQTARNALLEMWVKPEFLPMGENISHVETRFREDLDRVIALGLP